MLKVKHPGTAIVIWFLLGAFVYYYGIQTVADWVIFVIACILVYTIIYKARK